MYSGRPGLLILRLGLDKSLASVGQNYPVSIELGRWRKFDGLQHLPIP